MSKGTVMLILLLLPVGVGAGEKIIEGAKPPLPDQKWEHFSTIGTKERCAVTANTKELVCLTDKGWDSPRYEIFLPPCYAKMKEAMKAMSPSIYNVPPDNPNYYPYQKALALWDQTMKECVQ